MCPTQINLVGGDQLNWSLGALLQLNWGKCMLAPNELGRIGYPIELGTSVQMNWSGWVPK